ncbi:MAG: ribonuclease P protein subunit [Candidatus Woesearchaeota archaeon]
MNIFGCDVEVVDSSNKILVGIRGKVVDETGNIIVLDSGKRLVKEQVVLLIDGNRVDGKTLVGCFEERFKKARKAK